MFEFEPAMQMHPEIIKTSIRKGTLLKRKYVNCDASFLQDVPASLELPNLITVGATNQAGDATTFTSYGKTVLVYADGFHVESSIPGGKIVKFSGTSMASPAVTNLAAKLFAIDATLTPEQARTLIVEGSTPSEDGRRKLVDESRTIELARINKEKARGGTSSSSKR